MCCCNNVYHSCAPIARLAKERDELKRVLVQREKELKGANAACGELMGKVEELQALDKRRAETIEALHTELANRTAPVGGNKVPYQARAKVYDCAIGHFGSDAQALKAIEELAEVIVEIAKWWNNIGDLEHMAEEAADATIMLEQLRLM